MLTHHSLLPITIETGYLRMEKEAGKWGQSSGMYIRIDFAHTTG